MWMLSSKNVDDFVEVKFHAIVYMHQSQTTQPILTYGRSKIGFQAAKNMTLRSHSQLVTGSVHTRRNMP